MLLTAFPFSSGGSGFYYTLSLDHVQGFLPVTVLFHLAKRKAIYCAPVNSI